MPDHRHPSEALTRSFRTGLCGWLVFGVLGVWAFGVRWDENYEFAQALVGTVPYPEWHPLRTWVESLFSVQLSSTAWLVKLGGGPLLVNGFRNVLFFWATVVPPYLIGSAIGRSSAAGHAAAALVLGAVHVGFDGSYPQFIWPGMFSNGHIGTGFALAAIAVILMGRPLAGGVLAGLTPWVHLGQAPPVLLFAGAGVLALHARGDTETRNRLARGVAIGLAISAAAWGVHRISMGEADAPIPTEPLGSPHEVWAAWIEGHDMHRQPPGENGHLMALAFLAMGSLYALRAKRLRERDRVWEAALAYGLLILGIVYSILFIQLVFGTDVAPLLYTWLPYRLANHLPILLVGLLAAVLLERGAEGTPEGGIDRGWLALVVAFLAVRIPLGAFLAGVDLTYARAYLLVLEAPFYVLLGGALSRLSSDARGRAGYGVVVSFTVLTGAIHLFGAACFAVGFLGHAGLERRFGERAPGLLRRSWLVTALAALFAVTTLIRLAIDARHPDAAGSFERQVAQVLAERGDDNAMIVAPPTQITLQAQTGHPVLTDLATPYNGISYRPHLGPQINGMYWEVFGMDLRGSTEPEVWKAAWRERTGPEWQQLGEQYAFRYVVAPKDVSLDLTSIVEGETRRLYGVFGEGQNAGKMSAPPG